MEPADYLQQIDTGTGGRYDITRLCHEHPTLDALVADLTAPFEASRTDQVAGVEAVGFILGAALAREFDAGFVPVRKGGKLPIPEENRFTRSLVDYTGDEKRLELDRSAVGTDGSLLVVDDWIETGAQMTAAVELIEAAGGTVSGIATLGASGDATESLRNAYPFHAVLPLS